MKSRIFQQAVTVALLAYLPPHVYAEQWPIYGFEDVESGQFESLQTPLGTWTPQDGTTIVEDQHARTGKHCLQLTGGDKTRAVLKVAEGLDTTGNLTFWAERWTARGPFSFRIEKRSDAGWQEIFNGDAVVKVGREYLSHVKVYLGDGKIKELRFTVVSPPNTGVLLDDMRIAPRMPQEIVSVEAEPFTLPALVGNSACPLLKLKIETTGQLNPISLTQLQATLASTTDRRNVSAVSIHGGKHPRFSEAEDLGSLTGASLNDEVLKLLASTKSYQLDEGTNYVWIACELSDDANIDHRVGLACQQIRLSNGETIKLEAHPSAQRMGVVVRNGGDDGVHTYRIPGLTTTNKGTLIGVYDVRHRGGGDLPGDIDVGMSRSTDGGRTWEPMKVIMDMGNDPRWRYDGIGDPAVLVDRETNTIWVAATWSHGNRSWVGSGPGLEPQETGQLMFVRSDDDGLTWSEPINITKQVKRPEWCFILQGPGKGITMRDGTLVFAAQYQDPPEQRRLPHSTIIYSKDRGKSWQVGTGAFDDITEPQVVEIEPGVLMLNCRYNRKSARVVMTTRDMGKTWQEHPTSQRSLVEPHACMASLIDVGHELGKNGGSWLLFSNPDVDTPPRRRITIKASPDRGMTWPKEHRLLLDEGVSAGYSCMTMIDDKTVGILYEGSQAHMTFQRVPLVDVIGDKSESSSEQSAAPRLRLPSVFGDHMVLQADTPLPIWGTAKPEAIVEVRLGGELMTTAADDHGKWSIRFSPRPASSEPTTLVAKSAGEQITLRDVLVGEVWICAGQSNMEWPLALSLHGELELKRLTKADPESHRQTLRLLDLTDAPRGLTGSYTSDQLRQLTPKTYVRGQWHVASADAANQFSAVGWYFGRRLQQELNVPVGLICPAVGGSPAEAWIPQEALASNPCLRSLTKGSWLDNTSLGDFCRLRGEQNLLRAMQAGEAIPGDETGPNHPFKPGFLWSAAIEPLIPYAIRGVAWYQGESNAESLARAKQHELLFPLLVQHWRQHWRQGTFPFVYVQLPALNRPYWPIFREGQRRMLEQLENVGMATTIDTGHPTNVHPKQKRPVGERLAIWALRHTYRQMDVPATGPMIANANFVSKDRIELRFDETHNGLVAADEEPLRHFETASADGVFHPAAARIEGQQVVVEPMHGQRPQQVRYAWRPYPDPPVNLFNSHGLPASPFLVDKNEFDWQELPQIPDNFGFGGPLVGTHNGALIVAGGANFPHGPPWPEGSNPAGSKVWHETIFVLLPGEQTWREAGRLPRPLAYASVVSNATGMYVLGGESFSEDKKNHDCAEVLRLTWDSQKQQVIVEEDALPPLPNATSYHAAALIADTVFVAASHAKAAESVRLDTKVLWSINLGTSAEKRRWTSLPPWPGQPRFKMAMASARITDGDSPPSDRLFLFSGGTWVRDESGEHDLARYEYYDDAYSFDPATNQWKKLANLPKMEESREIDTSGYIFDRDMHAWRPLRDGETPRAESVHALFDSQSRAAAAAVAVNDRNGRILLFSGSTGRYVTLPVKDRPFFPREVLAYDVQSDRWSVAGRMPHAVVTTGATWWNGHIVIASGEVRPGVRTRKVQALKVNQ